MPFELMAGKSTAGRLLSLWGKRTSFVRPKTSTGPGPLPILRRPLPTASEAIRARGARGFQRRRPMGQVGGESRGMGAAGPVARRHRGGVRLRSRPGSRPSKKRSTSSVAVAAGDHDRLAGQVPTLRAPAPPGDASSPAPVSARASGMLGVTTVARGRSQFDQSLTRLVVEQVAPLSATITGSITTGASADLVGEPGRHAAIASGEPSMPIFTASTPMSSATARICPKIIAGVTPRPSRPRGCSAR